MFFKNRNISSKIKRSKVTDYVALNISQMFQFYIKEKFDVLRMFRLLVSSRYRRVRKMQLHLVLFALLFIQYLKRIMHLSFVSRASTYGDSRGIAGVRCWTITF